MSRWATWKMDEERCRLSAQAPTSTSPSLSPEVLVASLLSCPTRFLLCTLSCLLFAPLFGQGREAQQKQAQCPAQRKPPVPSPE